MHELLSLSELRSRRDAVSAANASLSHMSDANRRRLQLIGNSLVRQFPGIATLDASEIDAAVASIGLQLDVERARDAEVDSTFASVAEFWTNVRERLVNDCCAISCLYDVYVRRCERIGVEAPFVVDRGGFAETLERILAGDRTWLSPRVRGGGRLRVEMHSWVLEAEPIVLDELAVARRESALATSGSVPYGDLTQWVPPFVTGTGKKCTGCVMRRDAWERYRRLKMPPWRYITSQPEYVEPERPDLDAVAFWRRDAVTEEWYAAQARAVADLAQLWREA